MNDEEPDGLRGSERRSDADQLMSNQLLANGRR